MKNSFTYTVIFTFVLCFVFVIALSFVNQKTKPRIIENQKFEKNLAILKALDITPESDAELVSQQYDRLVKEETINNTTYYTTQGSEGKILATAYIGPALWGTIAGYISTTEAVDQIIGFSIVDQNETPGLGARIGEDWFIDQLSGQKIVNNNIVVRIGNGSKGDTNKDDSGIDGVTGATRTSDGVQGILTNSIKQFQKDLGR